MNTIAIPRTVRQIPRRHAARILPKPEPIDVELLPIVPAQIVTARSNARRAEIVLRLPDAVLLADGEAIASACRTVGFGPGAQFVEYRLLSLHAPRQPNGDLPEAHRKCLGIWRNGLAALAGGEAHTPEWTP